MPVNTPKTNPTQNPPPMKRLRTAAGKTMNAASTRKPSIYRNIAPTRTRLNTRPSTKPKLKGGPSAATHGKKATHGAKNAGHSNASPFAKISTETAVSNTTRSRL